jgi:hypothetical protein
MALLSSKYDPAQIIPQSNSDSEQWMQWHKSLKSNFGKQTANSLWVKAWKKRGNPTASTNALRAYLNKNGIQLNTSKWDDIVDTGVGAADFIGSFFKAGQWMTLGVGVIVVGGLGMIIFNLAKSPAESIGLAARAFVTKGK